jgi:hypothetical protein
VAFYSATISPSIGEINDIEPPTITVKVPLMQKRNDHFVQHVFASEFAVSIGYKQNK